MGPWACTCGSKYAENKCSPFHLPESGSDEVALVVREQYTTIRDIGLAPPNIRSSRPRSTLGAKNHCKYSIYTRLDCIKLTQSSLYKYLLQPSLVHPETMCQVYWPPQVIKWYIYSPITSSIFSGWNLPCYDFCVGGKAFSRPAHEVTVQDLKQRTHLRESGIQKSILQGKGASIFIREMGQQYKVFWACLWLFWVQDAPAIKYFVWCLPLFVLWLAALTCLDHLRSG